VTSSRPPWGRLLNRLITSCALLYPWPREGSLNDGGSLRKRWCFRLLPCPKRSNWYVTGENTRRTTLSAKRAISGSELAYNHYHSKNHFAILPGRGGLFHPHTPGLVKWKIANLNSRQMWASCKNGYLRNYRSRFKPFLDSNEVGKEKR
jgi:hypothetical protein